MNNSQLVVSVIAAAALMACGDQKPAPKAEKAASAPSAPAAGGIEVKIGHVGPLTGQIAHLGKDNENGARLAVEEANAAGIKIGGQAAKFTLLPEDDQADPKVGATVAQK